MKTADFATKEYVRLVRAVPFVKRARFLRPVEYREDGADGMLEIVTSGGTFRLLIEIKRTTLSLPLVKTLLAWFTHTHPGRKTRRLLVAHYVPPSAAKALIKAGVNFIDDAGNLHLDLGDGYQKTWVVEPAPARIPEKRPATPAELQLLFQFAIVPESVNWPVRRLQTAAGISKSRAAQARIQLIHEKLLTRIGKRLRLAPTNILAERLIWGYAQVLRPNLLVGRFRAPEKTSDAFLARLRSTAGVQDAHPALTGAAAAYVLQRFYHSPEVTLFVSRTDAAALRSLRLQPDKEGPITLLRAFGEVVFWEERNHYALAPPWLIYVELLASGDPRALEAAEEFRVKFLTDSHAE